MLFSLNLGSIGISFFYSYDKEILRNLDTLGKSYWRSYAIFRNISSADWVELQNDLPGSKLNIVKFSSLEESMDFIFELFNLLKDENKARQQIEYFKRV